MIVRLGDFAAFRAAAAEYRRPLILFDGETNVNEATVATTEIVWDIFPEVSVADFVAEFPDSIQIINVRV